MLGSQGDARVDEGARVQVGAVLARGAGKREDGEDGAEGRGIVGSEGNDGVVGRRAEDLANDEVTGGRIVLVCLLVMKAETKTRGPPGRGGGW